MITTPTVFVLGAGASVDFNFPVGKDLLQEVVEHLRSTTQIRDNVLASGFSAKEVDEFSDALRFSAEWSIDAFLEKRQAFMNIGKAAMAAELILREQTERIFSMRGGVLNWMQYLVGRMQGPSFEAFAENKVTFVTFNYDRVLEHYLCTALENAWGKTQDEVGTLLRKMSIIHLHGQLGFLPWQSDRVDQIRAFETTLDPERIRIAADGIKVVHEGIEDRREQFDAAKAAILAAQRTYLLGVGTGNVNLERLGQKDFPNAKVFATEVGLTQVEHDDAHRRFTPRIEFRQDTDCRRLISNFVQWG
jgi:hypothetical protein